MNLQSIIVIIIVFICVIYVGKHIMNYFKTANEDKNPCANCASGCELKRMMDEKKHECLQNKKKSDKKCCK